MNLLAVIIVLVLRHRGLMQEPAGAIGVLLRRWRDVWLQRGTREGWSPVLVVGLSVLLPALLLAVLLALPDGLWQRLAAGVAGLLVLAQAMLDQRVPVTVERYRQDWESRAWPVDTSAQSGLLAAGLVADSELSPARRDLVEESLRQVFAPLFWFLLLGPVAVAAAHAVHAHGLQRVAIIDFDVHHGNGSQDIFASDPRVMYASSHQYPLYPNSGLAHERGVGNVVNATLSPGTDGEAFRHAWREHLLPRVEAFRPQLVLVSAGFDGHRLDPLADLMLEADDYRWLSAELAALARRHADGRLVSMLEGGYSLAALRACSVAHLQGLSGLTPA